MSTDPYWLSAGAHAPHSEKCAMEWVAYLAGEPHSASPYCVDPFLAVAMIQLNDALEDEPRQRLRPFLARTIGTRDDGRTVDRQPVIDWIRCGIDEVRWGSHLVRLARSLSSPKPKPHEGWSCISAADLFVDELFRPGGLLDQLLPLEHIEIPPYQTPALRELTDEDISAALGHAGATLVRGIYGR